MKATSKLLTLLALILLSSISAISINAENRFYIDDFTISSGETKELAINLTNDVAFTGFQADIYLPEGLEVEQEDGEYIFDLTDRKGRDHTLSAERQNNGAIRILSYSLKLKEFSGTSGALVNFRVTASDDFSGNYQIQIKNITFATADQAGVDFESTVCNVVGKCLAESITLNMTEASLKVNETTILTATVLPETATNKTVTWTSSNEVVATVDANGVVTAVAVGEATITATTTDGSDLSASCKVTVKSGSTGLPISVTPKDGSTVAELQKIVFEFSAADYPNTMDYDPSKNPLLYNAAGEVVAEGHMGYADAPTYMSVYVTFDAPITAEGVYTLKVPEGAMREYGVENPKLCPAMELTYTIIPVKAESITLDKTEVEIIVGETEFLTVTILPETTSNKDIVWTSSDEEIAVVNEYGVVTAIAVGEATITATTADGSNLSASCQVTVVAALAESISLNMTEASIEVSRTTTLTATVLPETVTNKSVTWTSSNEAVATVDANGLVTAIAVGEATITATTTDGSNLSASCLVTVEALRGFPISITPEDGSTVAELQKIVFEFSAADYPNSMGYDSSKNPILYNAAGEVVAEGHMGYEDVVTYMSIYVSFDAPITAEGVYTLKVPEGAMREYGYGIENPRNCPALELTYNIMSVKAESIVLDKTEVEIVIGESDFLTATILPETTSNKDIVWTSSDEEIAVVNEYGVVTAVALGEATITATTTDGSNLSTSCKVTVVAALAESISLNMTEASLKVNETTTLTATVLPETATNKTVTWTSSNEVVATVDTNGLVTAVAVGEATITATTTDGSDLSASCKVTVESVSTGLPISVTPKDGSTVAELQKIVFEFSVEDYPKSMDYDSSKNPLLYNAAGEVVAEGHMGFEDAVTYMSIYVTFDAPITAEGVYTLKVPEGAMREYGFGGENPKLCPAMELTYTIIPVKAESITLDKTEVEIIVGETEFLTATVLPETTSNKTVVWSSSDEEIAVVNEYGVVTAIAVGEATITVTTADGSNLSASCQVTVVAALAESITLNMTEASLEVSETTTLTATVLPETVTNKSVTWTSSNESVATVDANGLVTAIAVGEATITATTTDGSNLSASCLVTVEALRGFPISITPEDGSTVGELQKIVFEFSAEDYPNTMEYDSSKNPILYNAAGEEVAEGHMGYEDASTYMSIYVIFDTPITEEGVYTLKVPAGAMREYKWGTKNPRNCPAMELTYNIMSVKAESIVLDKTEVEIIIGESDFLTATILPETASNKDIVWTSSDEEIAVVNEYGVVTAVALGEAVITATTTDGSDLSASCKVTVVPVLAMSIELDKTELDAMEMTEFQLTATVLPENTTNKGVVWSSSDNEIASVDETGLVKMLRVGSVVITATTVDGSNLSASCHITIVVGIDDVEGDNVIVATIGDNIVVKNVKLGSNVRVYAADGSIITSEIATDGDVVIEAPVKGIYIVAIDGKSLKVMVK